jgi:hypothetical protein
MRKKWILPGSCAAHKMGRKSAYFRVHAHVHLAGSGGMRMCLTLNGYGICLLIFIEIGPWEHYFLVTRF